MSSDNTRINLKLFINVNNKISPKKVLISFFETIGYESLITEISRKTINDFYHVEYELYFDSASRELFELLFKLEKYLWSININTDIYIRARL